MEGGTKGCGSWKTSKTPREVDGLGPEKKVSRVRARKMPADFREKKEEKKSA